MTDRGDAVRLPCPTGTARSGGWDKARPYPDARSQILEVTDAAIVDDIERRIALKSPPPRHPSRRLAAPA